MATQDEHFAKSEDASAKEAALQRLNDNLARVDALTQRMMAALAKRSPGNAALSAPDPEMFTKAAGAYWTEMVQHPARLFEQQATFWTKSVQHFMEAQQALATGKLAAPEDHTPDDARFSNPMWKSHPWFNFIKQQYMFNAEAIRKVVAEADLTLTNHTVDDMARRIAEATTPES